jgi:hypothetical protein
MTQRAILELGGPMRKISVNGKIYEFEMHPYCGPTILNRAGEPAKRQPKEFLKAASLWAQQGQRMEGDLCRWDHPPEPITRHVGGRHHILIGETAWKRGD